MVDKTLLDADESDDPFLDLTTKSLSSSLFSLRFFSSISFYTLLRLDRLIYTFFKTTVFLSKGIGTHV